MIYSPRRNILSHPALFHPRGYLIFFLPTCKILKLLVYTDPKSTLNLFQLVRHLVPVSFFPDFRCRHLSAFFFSSSFRCSAKSFGRKFPGLNLNCPPRVSVSSFPSRLLVSSHLVSQLVCFCFVCLYFPSHSLLTPPSSDCTTFGCRLSFGVSWCPLLLMYVAFCVENGRLLL